MSLNFSYEACAPALPNGDDPRCSPSDPEQWHAVGDALVWATLAVGIGEITDKTIDKFAFRLALLQKLDGPWLRYKVGERMINAYITREDVAAWKGLKTNATYKTEGDAAWLKRVFDNHTCTVTNEDDKPAYVIAHEVAARKVAA